MFGKLFKSLTIFELKYFLFEGLLMIVSVTSATDYCNKDICEGEAVPSHIGCGNDGDFAPSCPVERNVVPMTDDVITLILQRHNTARMNIANGDVGGFSPAERMIEMVVNSFYPHQFTVSDEY